MAKWERRSVMPGSENYFLRGENFYISYNSNPGIPFMGSMALGSDDGGPETALCHDGEFFILNGDYREDYEKLVPLGYQACKHFYNQQIAKSGWSS